MDNKVAHKTQTLGKLTTQDHREVGLDLCRFVYIFMMVAYHCFQNAILVSYDSFIDINRYLGLVSGSFPFLAGFLVSYHYLGTATTTDAVARRLLARATRLLAIYLLINLILVFFMRHILPVDILPQADKPWLMVLSGNARYVAYDILLPIAFTLFFGSVIALLTQRTSITGLPVLAVACMLIAAVSNHAYLASGLLGLAVGFRPVDGFLRTVTRPPFAIALALAYGLVFTANFNEPRNQPLLYVLGVLTLFSAIRTIGNRYSIRNKAALHEINLYAKYTLIIYLVHVPVLAFTVYALRAALEPLPVVVVFSGLLFYIYVLMSMMTRGVDLLRKNSGTFNRTYRAVFD